MFTDGATSDSFGALCAIPVQWFPSIKQAAVRKLEWNNSRIVWNKICLTVVKSGMVFSTNGRYNF